MSECCPLFDPARYDNQEFEWNDKLFLKDYIYTFMYMPLFGNFGKCVVRNMKVIEDAGAHCVDDLLLCESSSMWSTTMFFAVDQPIPNANIIKLSGPVKSKVFDGPYSEIPKFIEAFKGTLKPFESVDRLFLHYPYCPPCAEKFKKNYIVVVATLLYGEPEQGEDDDDDEQ